MGRGGGRGEGGGDIYAINFASPRSFKSCRRCIAVFLLQRAKYSTGKLSLDDLLIKPVQRIPRYLLFIKDLLKHTSTSHPDHAPLQQALDELTGLAERVNESEREMARMDRQKELLAAVDGLALVSEAVSGCLVSEAVSGCLVSEAVSGCHIFMAGSTHLLLQCVRNCHSLSDRG